MDGIRCKEWRIFPGLSFLGDELGFKVFIFSHIPLFFLFFYFLYDDGLNTEFIRGLDVFLIIHFLLHLLFLKHKKNEFKDWISWSVISAAALCGVADLLTTSFA
jgi:hypothetical protein